MSESEERSDQDFLRREIESVLMEQHGPMIGGHSLSQALGYPSYDAFCQAVQRKQVTVPIFQIANRRGRFALTRDVAIWLVAQRDG